MCRINHTIVSDVTICTLSGGNIMKLGQWKSTGLVDYKTLLTENEKLKQDIDQLKSENKALRLQADEYFDLWQEAIKK